MGNVSKEMVDAVRLARLQDWERMATRMPKGQHILSVEMLRAAPNQTAIVLTIARDGKVHQFELVADAKGQNAKPVITRRGRVECDDPKLAEGLAEGPAPLAGGEEDTVANGVPLNYPPDKEPPDPGVVSLGSSLLETTFDLGEQVAGSNT
jgi:hypothetical protein